MSHSSPDPKDDAAARLRREILASRPFQLADAIGQMTGGDLLKGASPVTRQRQIELSVAQSLKQRLSDPEGALHTVLVRRVREAAPLCQPDLPPLTILTQVVETLLASPPGLQDFVREVDSEWGRMYQVRPFFDSAESPPNPDDPYTIDSVRDALERLVRDRETA